jgi:hypothetical protein
LTAREDAVQNSPPRQSLIKPKILYNVRPSWHPRWIYYRSNSKRDGIERQAWDLLTFNAPAGQKK